MKTNQIFSILRAFGQILRYGWLKNQISYSLLSSLTGLFFNFLASYFNEFEHSCVVFLPLSTLSLHLTIQLLLNLLYHSLDLSFRTHSSFLLPLYNFFQLVKLLIKVMFHTIDSDFPILWFFFEILLKTKQLFRQVIEAGLYLFSLNSAFLLYLFAQSYDSFLRKFY